MGIYQAVALLMGGVVAPPGQQVFTADGSFVVPAGVTSISAVCVGAGGWASNGTGRGGDLRYAISIAVVPGETLTVEVPIVHTDGSAQILRSSTVLLEAASGGVDTAVVGTSSTIGGNIGGGDGGRGRNSTGAGGGAGGYSGNGGAASSNSPGAGSAGVGGGGGGGAVNGGIGGGGGGVGLLGEGPSGAGGTTGSRGGKAGSGGTDGGPGTSSSFGGPGGLYGGGNAWNSPTKSTGAVRIIWGAGRAYPSTNTADA